MTSKFKCVGFSWSMQGHAFFFNMRLLDLFNMRLLNLGGYDMVLGMNWMRAHNSIKFDYENVNVSFKKDRKIIELARVTEEMALKLMLGKQLQKMFKKGPTGMCFQFFSLHSVAINDEYVKNKPNTYQSL